MKSLQTDELLQCSGFNLCLYFLLVCTCQCFNADVVESHVRGCDKKIKHLGRAQKKKSRCDATQRRSNALHSTVILNRVFIPYRSEHHSLF